MSMDDQNITRISPPPFGVPTRPRQKQPDAIEESLAVTRQLEQKITPSLPTYRDCVAESINECRYLDVKGIAKDIMGEPVKTIETAADLADRMAEWAAANKAKVPA